MQQPEHDHDAAAMDNKLAKTNSSDLSPARTLEDDGSLKLSEKSFGVIKSEAAAIWMSRNYVWCVKIFARGRRPSADGQASLRIHRSCGLLRLLGSIHQFHV